jgi:hypothetical protein
MKSVCSEEPPNSGTNVLNLQKTQKKTQKTQNDPKKGKITHIFITHISTCYYTFIYILLHNILHTLSHLLTQLIRTNEPFSII